MELMYSTNVPPRRGLVYWKKLEYADEETIKTANEWLEKRFGTEPLIYQTKDLIITHPANRGLIEQTTGNHSGATYTNLVRTIYGE